MQLLIITSSSLSRSPPPHHFLHTSSNINTLTTSSTSPSPPPLSPPPFTSHSSSSSSSLQLLITTSYSSLHPASPTPTPPHPPTIHLHSVPLPPHHLCLFQMNNTQLFSDKIEVTVARNQPVLPVNVLRDKEAGKGGKEDWGCIGLYYFSRLGLYWVLLF